MNKILMGLVVICMSLILYACTANDPVPQPTLTPAPVAEIMPMPAPEPEPAEPVIEVTLDNYHTRYYDDHETQFEFTVIGDFDSYEIVFMPIEISGITPELTADGLPYGVGQYMVVVDYIFGDLAYTFESDIVVSIVRRPGLLEQLIERFEIPGDIKWGEETFIFVDEDTIIETDYYIARLDAGSVYSSWLFPFFDDLIDFVHVFTGLNLSDRGERFNLYFAYDEPERGIYVPSSDRNRRTKELEMHLSDALVGINTSGYWTYRGKDSYSISEDPFFLVYQASHEFAHILDFAFFTENRDIWSFIHGEGFTTFISAISEESMIPNAAAADIFPLSVNADTDVLSELFHSRLEYALGLDYGSEEFNSRTIGSVFYLYVFEEFGMDKVKEVFSTMINCPSGPRVVIINDILGADINETFPVWFDENVYRIAGRYA